MLDSNLKKFSSQSFAAMQKKKKIELEQSNRLCMSVLAIYSSSLDPEIVDRFKKKITLAVHFKKNTNRDAATMENTR